MCEVVVTVTLLLDVDVRVVNKVVTVEVTCNGTNRSGLMVTTGALNAPTTAEWLPPNAVSTLLTMVSRNDCVYNCTAIALVDEPSGTTTKQLNFVPSPPAGLEDSIDDEPLSPNRSCTSDPNTSAT